ncbi:hypothetical protein T4D_12779 [Trichinella pseudospiralis]|uniref:Uncharacterized protein n=1 Tax=Trichinella pseudospiralis TaxID=6337 RepID=A0A0V1FJ00_TRIPS|nr:hypothetical protein T4D_12779 [Trichinella pseudospiralis]
MSAIGMERHKIMQAKAISARMWEEPCGKHPPEASSKSTTIAFSLTTKTENGIRKDAHFAIENAAPVAAAVPDLAAANIYISFIIAMKNNGVICIESTLAQIDANNQTDGLSSAANLQH